MNIEDIKTEFPAMPEEMREMIARTVSQQLRAEEPAKRKRARTVRRTAILAFAAALALSVTALAVAASRVSMDILRYGENGVVESPAAVVSEEQPSAESGEAEGVWADEPYVVDISFEKIDGEWIGLGAWYPQRIPDGYEETFISENHGGQSQRLVFENAEGRYFDLNYETAGPGGEVGLSDVIYEQAVTVGEHAGTLFRNAEGYALLVWTDETRGLGFFMTTDDPELDLVSVARSVGKAEWGLTPTRAAGYAQALEELGDYTVTALPEGFAESSMEAAPLEDGGGWYGYVRRRYENAAHDEIFFSYETFAFDDDDTNPHTAETILSYHGAGSSETVNGMPAGASEGKVVWVDWDQSLVFTLKAEGFSAEELLAMAESVR